MFVRCGRPTGCWQRWVQAWLLLAGLVSVPAHLQAEDDGLVQRMTGGGHVLMIRHAEAPGIGDPDGFRLDDCATQRNLSESGREQARRIGAWLRARGIERARVYSSQWCRCMDTARLLSLGSVTELPALNSFFEHPENREPNLTALRRFLAGQPRDGELIVLVTHQVTISALTGEFTSSGHGVLLALTEGGEMTIAGRTGFGQ